ncbi:MAG: aminoglycoside phosphotransferase family protein [Chloroflexota bacterium]|nr:aminoglycoside phosphotransferase family protein [Chloroflexota bacterium]
MLEDPGLDGPELRRGLRIAYGIEPSAARFVPGYDLRAASYEMRGTGGPWFVKIRVGPFPEPPLEVPRALLEAGVTNVLAPLRTTKGRLAEPMGDDRTVVVYPFVSGRNAMEAGMSAEQWRAFGSTLRAVHESGLEREFADRLPAEAFALPSAPELRIVLSQRPALDSPAAERLRSFLDAQADRIGVLLERAGELGRRLAYRPFERVPCHADIHAANILVADDGRILLVDWDGPMLAPRERDLLFVIGSRIARKVEPQEEAWFFAGYGDATVDPEAIVYFRYERMFEDIGVDAASVFGDPALPEPSRKSQADTVERYFAPGGFADSIEDVGDWPATR